MTRKSRVVATDTSTPDDGDDPANRTEFFSPDDVEDDPDRTTSTAPAPTGKLRGSAPVVLAAIIDARVTGAQKDVLLWLFHETYTRPLTDPQWGWVWIDLSALAERFHTTKSDISERLNFLYLTANTLTRRAPKEMCVSLTHPKGWSPTVFDWEAARAKHTRAGAGAPKFVRERAPETPLAARATDVRGDDFLTRAFFDDAPYADEMPDEATREAHWKIIEAFQRLHDERFRIEWIVEVTWLLERTTPAAVIATLAQQKRSRTIRGGYWKYLIGTYRNAHILDAKERTHDATTTSPTGPRPGTRIRSDHRRTSGETAPSSGLASRFLNADDAADNGDEESNPTGDADDIPIPPYRDRDADRPAQRAPRATTERTRLVVGG